MSSVGRLLRLARHPLAVNAASLTAVQLGLTLLPLLSLPYLARVLGPSEFGAVALTQAFAFLASLFVEYGFGLSGVRAVAQSRGHEGALARIVANIQGAKLLLCVLPFLAALIALPAVQQFRERPLLLVLGVLFALSLGLHPMWFFVGTERVVLPTIVEAVVRTLLIVSLLLFVKHRDDATIAMTVYVAFTALSVTILTFVMYRRAGSARPTLAGSRAALRDGLTLFTSAAAVSVYQSTNVFIVGLFLPGAQVAFYSGGDRIVRVAARVINGIGGAVFPRVSFLSANKETERAERLAVVTLVVLGGLGALAAGFLALFAPFIVRVLYGPQFKEAAGILRILALVVPLNMVAAALATQWLIVRGRDRAVTSIVVCAGLVNIVLVLIATPLYGLRAAAWSQVLAEALAVVAAIVVVRRDTARRDREPPPITSDIPPVPTSLGV